MVKNHGQSLKLGILIAALASLLMVSMACASTSEPTAAPIQPAPAVPPSAPAAAPTAAPVAQATATAVVVAPTPTRVLPTATATSTSGPQYGGTLRFALSLSLDTLDPAFNVLSASYVANYAIYDFLFRLDQQSNVLPGLAESWDISSDGKSITLRLRKGVQFHDGTPFNAQAVKWNFDRILDPTQNSPRRAELQPYLTGSEVVDDSTLRLQLTNPFRPFLPLLGSERIGWLVSPTAVQKFGGGVNGNFGRNPVGTGPFRFAEWVPDTRILLRRNDSYWEKGKPYLDTIELRGASESSLLQAMIRTGEADIISNLSVAAKDVPVLEKSADLQIVRILGSDTHALQINPLKAPYDSLAMRQAISYGVDKQKYVDILLVGAGRPAYTMIASGWGYSPDLKPIPYDLAKAKQKLAEAGYVSGTPVRMGCRTSGIGMLICEFMQATLKDAGINLALEVVPSADYSLLNEWGALQRQGLRELQFAHRVDPHINLQRFFQSKGGNNYGYSNPAVDKLIDEAAAVYDVAKAKPLYDRIQTMVAEDSVAPAMGWADRFQVINKRVKNFIAYPTVFEHLEFTWLQK